LLAVTFVVRERTTYEDRLILLPGRDFVRDELRDVCDNRISHAGRGERGGPIGDFPDADGQFLDLAGQQNSIVDD
jgi:hypothetical protein